VEVLPSPSVATPEEVVENFPNGSCRGANGELSPRGEFFGVLSLEDIFLSAFGFFLKSSRASRSFLAFIFSLTHTDAFGVFEDWLAQKLEIWVKRNPKLWDRNSGKWSPKTEDEKQSQKKKPNWKWRQNWEWQPNCE
jgi:hypothetical protein